MDPHVSGRKPRATAPSLAEAMALKYPSRLRRLGVLPKRNRRPANPTNTCSRRSLPFRIPSSSQQPRDHHHHHHHPAMDLFPDGAFVRLQSRVTGKFVHADGDWEKVSLRSNGAVPALNAVWRVQHWVSPVEGDIYVLLQNAAFGRYLSLSIRKAPSLHRGRRTAQKDRSEPHNIAAYPWGWEVERLDPPDQDYVSLRCFTCYLRANGKYIAWNNRVTADVDPDAPMINTMMHWRVHEVAASPVPMDLPLRLEDEGLNALVYPHPPRTIRYVRANDEGEFDQNHHNWSSFPFYDSSLIDLMDELGPLQDDWNGDVSAYTLCMRPGSHGRLMPLVTDLPGSLDSMNIVVLRAGSPAAAALVYPAPPPPPHAGAA